MKNTLKSIGALLAGIVVVFALSTVTDMILETNGWMKIPFNDNPLWLKLLVVIYRNIYVILASYVVATMAPSNPMKHAIIFGCIGLVLATLGAFAMWHEPPHWYPVTLIILGFPAAWLGGKIRNTKTSPIA
jgi:hypothetical protein